MGVLKGTVRGRYKTKSLTQEIKDDLKTIDKQDLKGEFKNVAINNSSNVRTNISKSEKVEEEVIKEIKPIVTDGEDKYAAFKVEYGSTPDEKKEDTEIKTETKQEEKNTEDIKNPDVDFTKINSNNSGGAQPTTNIANKTASPILVNGFMLLALCDIAIPSLIKWIYLKVDEDAKSVKIKDAKLDEDQREALKESADIAAKYIFEKLHPLAAFGVGLIIFYGQNFMMEVNEVKAKRKVRKMKLEAEKVYQMSDIRDTKIIRQKPPVKVKQAVKKSTTKKK